jgi:hypothetical protein
LKFYPLFKENGDLSTESAAAEVLDEILHSLESTSSHTRRFELVSYSLFDGEMHPDGREFIMPEGYEVDKAA